MCATIARLNVALGLDDSGFSSGIQAAAASAEKFTAKAANIGRGMSIGITAPILAAGAAAMKFGGDLNSGLANVAALGVASDRVAQLKGNVQDMAVVTGKSTTDLTAGLYQTVSAFGDTADTAAILEINAKSAAAGLADTSEAIALTSSVTKGYGDTSATAVQHVADLALQTVSLGQTTFPELAASMGSVVPLASSLGASQEELFASMATLTGVTGNASAVSTQLRGVLQSLMAPTESMSGLMTSMGYSTADAMLKGEGLQGTIAAIVQASQASGTPLQSYIGSIEGQTAALALAGPQAASYGDKLAAMASAAGATDKAFAAQTEGINANGFAMTQMQAKLEVTAQKLGDALAPALTMVLDKVTPLVDWIGQMAGQLSTADPSIQMMVVGFAAAAAAMGPILTLLPGIVAGVTALGAVIGVLTSPIGLVVVAVGLLAAAWSTDFGGIQEKTAAVWAVIEPYLSTAVNWLQTNIPTALTALQTAWNTTWTALQTAVSTAQTTWTDFTAKIGELQTAIGGVLSGKFSWTISLPTWLTNVLKFAWPELPEVPSWLQTLFDWAWPLLPGAPVVWLASLLDWGWPEFPAIPDWIAQLFKWQWPSPPDVGGAAAGAAGAVGDAVGGAVGAVGNFFGGKAIGGPVTAGVPYIVGERGQELFVPNVNGRIIPNSELGGLAAAGEGQQPLVVNNYGDLHSPIDLNALTFAVAERMARRR